MPKVLGTHGFSHWGCSLWDFLGICSLPRSLNKGKVYPKATKQTVQLLILANSQGWALATLLRALPQPQGLFRRLLSWSGK